MTKKEEWLAGTRSAVPIMLGYVPVGIAYGVMARQAGLNTWQTVLMSLTVYARPAQTRSVRPCHRAPRPPATGRQRLPQSPTLLT